MQTKLNPYINFRNNAREAMTFYHTVFGGELKLMTFKDFHVPVEPSEEELIMHASLETRGGMLLTASDLPARMEYKPGTTISLLLSGDDEAELGGYFEKLGEGAQVETPLKKEMWGDTYGALTDRFGVRWMVNITAKKS